MALPSGGVTVQSPLTDPGYSIQFAIKGPKGSPIQGFPYEVIQKSTGHAVARGLTDENGCTERYYTSEPMEMFELVEHVEFGGVSAVAPSPRVPVC